MKMKSMRNLLEDPGVEMSYHTSGMESLVSIEELKHPGRLAQGLGV
jgi:hypothetical protein